MLQKDVLAPDLEIRWVSSLSWYFLNLFGLRGFFKWILGDEFTGANASNFVITPNAGAAAGAANPQIDYTKIFASEKESLEIMDSTKWIFNKY